MGVPLLTGVLALAGLVFALVAFGSRWSSMRRLPFPKDRSLPKGSAQRGLVYAFTLGMAPWAKESTRLHWVSYLRGIAFHIGIFAGLAVLFVSPWLSLVPWAVHALFALLTGLGAVMGVAGGIMRIAEHELRSISTPDDHTAVWLVTAWLAVTALALVAMNALPLMWLVAAVMLFYAPLGKIRHCIYFYFGRLFFGLYIGRRGIVRGLEASHGR